MRPVAIIFISTYNFNLSYKHNSLRTNNKAKFILFPSSIVFSQYTLSCILILTIYNSRYLQPWSCKHKHCVLRIKYESKSHTYTHTGPWLKVGMEYSSKFCWWGLSTITWVMDSCAPQLPIAPAGHAMLNFTYLQCSEASSIPILCPTKA